MFQPAPILLHSRSTNASRGQWHIGPQEGNIACSLTIPPPSQHGKKNKKKKNISYEPFGKGHSSLQDRNSPVKHHCLHAKCPSVLQAGLESWVCLLFVKISVLMLYAGQIKKYLLDWFPIKIPTTGHWRETVQPFTANSWCTENPAWGKSTGTEQQQLSRSSTANFTEMPHDSYQISYFSDLRWFY